jgi:hypothetical protein
VSPDEDRWNRPVPKRIPATDNFLLRKYQFMEANNQRRARGLRDKIPDIQKTLDTVRFLQKREVCSRIYIPRCCRTGTCTPFSNLSRLKGQPSARNASPIPQNFCQGDSNADDIPSPTPTRSRLLSSSTIPSTPKPTYPPTRKKSTYGLG